MYPHRPSIPELLERLKGEFDTFSQETNIIKKQRDEFEKMLQNQLADVGSLKATISDLEHRHSSIKKQYEEEIGRLRGIPRHELPSVAPMFHSSQPADLRNPEKSGPPASVSGGRPGPQPTNSLFSYSQPPLGAVQMNQPPPKRPRGEQESAYPGNTLPSISGITSDGLAPSASLSAVSAVPMLSGKGQEKPETHPSTLSSLADHDKITLHAKSRPPEQVPMKREQYEEFASDAPPEDWRVGYNPNVHVNLNVDLAFDLAHDSVVCCVNFSKDGKWLATGCNRSAQVYSVQTGEKLFSFADENVKPNDLYYRSVCFSPDGKYLAGGAEDKTIKIWNIEKKQMANILTGHELDIYSVDFSSDGKTLVSGSGDKKAKIWNIEKGKCVYTLGNDEVGPKDGVTSVAISPDGRLVAAGSLDKIVRLWDAQTGYFLERYEGHEDSVYSVAFSPDGKSLASGSLDKTLRLWDLSGSRARSRCRATFSGHNDFVLSVTFSPDGNWLISGSKDRSVQFWDPRSALTYMKLEGHKNSVISVAVNPIQSVFATGSGDNKARLWKYKTPPGLDR